MKSNKALIGTSLLVMAGLILLVWGVSVFESKTSVDGPEFINARALYFCLRDTAHSRVEVGKDGTVPVFIWDSRQGQGEARISVYGEGDFTLEYIPDLQNRSRVHMLKVDGQGLIRDGFRPEDEDTKPLWVNLVAGLPTIKVVE